jgi:hypothetical protein
VRDRSDDLLASERLNRPARVLTFKLCAIKGDLVD